MSLLPRPPRSSLTLAGGYIVNHADYHYTYTRLRYPSPNWKYASYPFYTPGGNDRRWNGSGEAEEDGLQWVGGMMYVDVIRFRLPP